MYNVKTVARIKIHVWPNATAQTTNTPYINTWQVGSLCEEVPKQVCVCWENTTTWSGKWGSSNGLQRHACTGQIHDHATMAPATRTENNKDTTYQCLEREGLLWRCSHMFWTCHYTLADAMAKGSDVDWRGCWFEGVPSQWQAMWLDCTTQLSQ